MNVTVEYHSIRITQIFIESDMKLRHWPEHIMFCNKKNSYRITGFSAECKIINICQVCDIIPNAKTPKTIAKMCFKFSYEIVKIKCRLKYFFNQNAKFRLQKTANILYI